MTEQELTSKLVSIIESQRSKWEQRGDKMVFTQENFTIKNAPVTVAKTRAVTL